MEADEFIADLLHEAGQFQNAYDPVKAHEYYIRTRELKARGAASVNPAGGAKKGKNKQPNPLVEKKKGELGGLADKHKQARKALQEVAKGKREEIAKKIQEVAKQVAAKTAESQKALQLEKQSAVKDLSTRTQALIAALPPLPKGASLPTMARIRAKRQGEINKIQGAANAERLALDNDFTGKSNKIASDAKFYNGAAIAGAQKSQVDLASTIKGSVAKAQADYKAKQLVVTTKYKAESEAGKKKTTRTKG